MIRRMKTVTPTRHADVPDAAPLVLDWPLTPLRRLDEHLRQKRVSEEEPQKRTDAWREPEVYD